MCPIHPLPRITRTLFFHTRGIRAGWIAMTRRTVQLASPRRWPSVSRTFPINLSTLPSGQAENGAGNCLIYRSTVDHPRGVEPVPPGTF